MQRCGRYSRHAKRQVAGCLRWQNRRSSSFLNSENRNVPTGPLEAPKLPLTEFIEDIAAVAKNAAARKVPIADLYKLPTLVKETKELRGTIGQMNAERKTLTDKIQSLPAGTPEKASAVAEGRKLRDQVQKLQYKLAEHQGNFQRIGMAIPNWSHKDVAIGDYRNINEIATGGPTPIELDGKRDHTKIAAALGLLNLTSASVVTGTSWYYLLEEAVALEQALVNYALFTAGLNGWKMVTTPDVIKADVAWRCGFQPREDEAGQTFFVESSSTRAKKKNRGWNKPGAKASPKDIEDEALVLAGTAEIPLAGLFASQTFRSRDFPMTVVGLGKAFRAEAGARGVQTRGLYRVHQFTKVELFAVTDAESSEQMMETMLSLQRQIIDGLGIPYRVLDMPTEELGASAWRKYDIEAWMPGRGEWGEICSLSNCTDYQSRRLNVRYLGNNQTVYAGQQPPGQASKVDLLETAQDRREKHLDKKFAHTLNGTAAAIPRLIITLLENGAVFAHGEVVALRLPQSLRRFWIGSEERIEWVETGQSLSPEGDV
ncbi:seryl-tRNA synthetase [Calocera viscosa TUFC12733]|uniref:serine--tRNA ligase n=1 Tax=Calocera viscosa (strain TUFC12733) TaxID=1330018 RepID=A0A167FMC1_CALVF|nr:seryl-tRNA synthetase [Calocera viscosa TUFC12733]